MARRRLPGLQRVLGVNALFATAYGNVGSSIYYALGLVASFALGLTPVVFVIAGVHLLPDGGHLRRGHRDVPGGGRFLVASPAMPSTSSGRSSPPGRRCSTTRSRSPSRRSSCLTTWRSVLAGAQDAGRHVLRHRGGRVLWRDQRHRGHGAAALNVVLAVIDFATQLLLVVVGGRPGVLQLDAGPQRPLGVAPEWKNFLDRDPGGDDRLHGDETISNMAEEAKDEAKMIPRRSTAW